VRVADGDVSKAVRENVRNQAIRIADASSIISKLIQQGELIVAGGVYDMQKGRVDPINIDL
ncbi:hypothetical protein ABTK07_19260, partial [Acinetobacter baumannii]